MNPLAFSIAETCEAARTGRTSVYAAIAAGELRAVKRGKRTLILADDLRRWLESLPVVTPKCNPPDRENEPTRSGPNKGNLPHRK